MYAFCRCDDMKHTLTLEYAYMLGGNLARLAHSKRSRSACIAKRLKYPNRCEGVTLCRLFKLRRKFHKTFRALERKDTLVRTHHTGMLCTSVRCAAPTGVCCCCHYHHRLSACTNMPQGVTRTPVSFTVCITHPRRSLPRHLCAMHIAEQANSSMGI